MDLTNPAAPVFIRIETKSGHGAGRPLAKIFEEYADRWAFLWRELGMKSSAEQPR